MVPAVRTEDQAMSLLNELASLRLAELARSQAYQKALQAVNELRSAAVRGVQEDLQSSIASYLPSIKTVEVETRDVRQSAAVSRVVIDDGSATSLDQKGDGIKSLFALALIQHLAHERTSEPGSNLVLLVDEPEAHLHSKAIHDLQALFTKISRTQQVVLATHNAIFVNREQVNANILVQMNSASSAGSVKKIRATLGVEPQDNLDSAEVIVLTEGWTDAQILPCALMRLSPRVQKDVESGRVFFKATTGAGKLRSHIQRERSTGCRLVVVLDRDPAGEKEAKRLHDEGVIDMRSVYTLSDGKRKTSEIEDMVEPAVYLASLSKKFGRTFAASHFASVGKKWSDDFRSAAISLAVAGDEAENLKLAKIVVCDAVRAFDGQPFKEAAMPGLRALSESIWANAN